MPLSFGYLSQTEKISEIKPPLKEVNKVLKSYSNERTFSWHSGFEGHRFLQVLSHFRGFEPHLRRYFFLKSDIKWTFLHFDVLKSYVISLKTQKFVKEISKIAIAIYLCSIM